MKELMDWDAGFLTRSPMFEPLRGCVPAVLGANWPDRRELQQWLDRRAPAVTNAGGSPLRLVPQGGKPRSPEDRYEARVFLRGELQLRERDWHDLLNLLVWLAFPRAKAALNARHYGALREQWAAGASNRGPTQDALTLFDEGGVVVASADDELTGHLLDWRWKELFWGKRALLRAHMRFYLFGHALYEKALNPFRGITGRGIVLRTGRELLAAPLGEQLAAVDAGIAQHVSTAGRLATTRELAVVPVLGVPGWCAENERESYYDDPDYFRAGRAR